MAGLRLDLGRIDKDLTAQLANRIGADISGDSSTAPSQSQEMDPLSDGYSPDDHLTPVEKLEKYFQSEEAYEREIAVRSMVDAGFYVDNYADFELILEIVNAMASDHEPIIRIGVLSTVVSLLERNTQFRDNPDHDTSFGQENEDKLYEIPVKMLNDFNQQVRRMSHNTIVLLLEEPKSSLDSLIAQLCTMVQKCLGKEENYDLRMDTVKLISRTASYLGQSVCVNEFMALLPSLASDNMFHVRMSFAICCKDLCAAVGQSSTEGMILPYFLQLCKDEVWGVRKACADVFMDVSLACSLITRQEKLTPTFLLLLKDDSRWVRKAAYQCLGPFISTFYTPSLNETVDSIEPLSETELFETSLLGSSSGSNESRETLENSNDTEKCLDDSRGTTECSGTSDTFDNRTPSKGSPSHVLSPLMIFHTPPQLTSALTPPTEDSQYSSFQFWRSPISILPTDAKLENTNEKEGVVNNSDKINDNLKLDLFGGVVIDDEINSLNEGEEDEMGGDRLADIKDELLAESERGGDACNDVFPPDDGLLNKLKLTESPLGTTPNGFPKVRVFIQGTNGQIHEEDTAPSGCGYSSTPFDHLNTTSRSVPMEMTLMESAAEHFVTTTTGQDLVPDELIDLYLGMVDPVKSQNVDADLPLYCAFSFPAVLNTLGSEHWPLLKPTFDALSSDMQWKIRRILAHSLHEIARILGTERTVSDLLSIVDEYSTKDLDDVKMGILSHLSEFFEILPKDIRREYFPSVLSGILDIENEKNWRYRDSLAEQLTHLCELFDCSFVEKHIVPVAIKLGHDRIAQIRESASNLVGVLLQKFNRSSPSSCPPILKELRESYASSDRWILRLMYIKQCDLFLSKRLVSCSLFATECLPSLLSLSKDAVPNVRLTLGKLLYSTVLHIDFFSSNYSLSNNIQTALHSLQNDSDRDVRYFSGSAHIDSRPRPHGSAPQRTNSLSEGEENDVKLDIGKAASLLYLS